MTSAMEVKMKRAARSTTAKTVPSRRWTRFTAV
jgi:hypothetical protein